MLKGKISIKLLFYFLESQIGGEEEGTQIWEKVLILSVFFNAGTPHGDVAPSRFSGTTDFFVAMVEIPHREEEAEDYTDFDMTKGCPSTTSNVLYRGRKRRLS